MEAENADWTSGGSFGHYRLGGEIGYGGMGAVYRAQDVRSGQAAAVKLLPPEYLNDLGLRASFEREAQLVASLDHEAITPVYEFGVQDGQPFIAMQYMSNGSLADRLLHGPLDPEEAAAILERVCRAIDYAHQRGVIHRDLKPSNILFDEQGRAYLADFGIAWQAAHPAGIQPAGAPVSGTPAYLSPEQALGEAQAGARSDIYALGIILFEMLAGQAPFAGETPLAVILQHIHDRPPSLRAVDPSLPAALDEVIQRALEKDPAGRFPSAGALDGAFRAALAGESAAAAEEAPAALGAEGQVEGPDSAEGPAQPATGTVEITPAGTPAAPAQADNLAAARPAEPRAAPQESSGSGSWRLAHLVALALATIAGLLLAAALAAFLQVRKAAVPSGVEITFDSQALVLTNFTDAPLDLSGLVFRGASADGFVSGEFAASQWAQLPGSPSPTLQPGACFELLHPQAASFELGRLKTLPVPQNCRNLQGWLVAQGPESLFWSGESGEASFQVLLNGSFVQTCPLQAGRCQFSLPPP